MSEDYGTQDDGSFRRKHVDDVVDDMEREFRKEAGEDVELRPGSPQKQLIDSTAIEISRTWQAAEGAYYASFYEDLFGEALDKQLALAGFSRIPARSATGEVVFSREDPAPEDIEIPAGEVVTTVRTETRPPIPYETIEGVVLDEGETEVTAPIEALKPWQTDLEERWLGEETNVAANTITRMEDPIAGIDAVNNPDPTGDEELGFVSGRNRETDAEFKLRYENSLAEGGAATLEAVRSTVFNASDDIASVRVDEVRDIENGEAGVRVIVLAPNVPDDTIAQAIVESRGAGLESFGAETGTGQLEDGTETTESFDRATEITTYVDATLETTDTFPDDGETRIENAIIRYIGGEAYDEILYPGLEIGADGIFDQVKRRVMEIRGVVQADVSIGTNPDPTASDNIAIADDEAAMTGIDEITLTVN